MTNIETYKQFIEGYTAGIRRIGPHKPMPGPGRPGKPIGPKPKPKPKPGKEDRPNIIGKVNERGGGAGMASEESEFDAAIRLVKELADYLEMNENDLAEIIYNGWLSMNPEDAEEVIIHNTETGEERTRKFPIGSNEKFYSLMYSYGLI